jgi:RNase P protein component
MRAVFSWGAISVQLAPSFSIFIIVSKKTFPRAVDRNRAKRRIRAAVATHRSLRAVVRIYPNRATLTAPFVGLKRDLGDALRVR